MRNLLKFSAAIIMCCFLFSSCKKKNETAKMIPADAVLVSYWDTKSLLDKLPFEDIKATQMYKDMQADTSLPSWGREILENPKAAGVDIQKGLVFFVQKGAGENFNIVLEGAVSNAGDFEKFNKNMDNSAQVTDQKGVKMMTLHGKSVAAWNDKDFVYVFNTNADRGNMQNWNEDSTMMPKIPEGDLEAAKTYAQSLFTLSSDASLAKDDHFTSLLNDKGDMKLWLNNEKLMNLSPSMGMLGMMKLDAIIKDSRTAYNIDFNNGEINMEQKSYYNKEMTDLIKKYIGDDVKNDEISKIPSQNILGVLAFNFKPEGLKEMLKMMGMDGMVNTYGAQVGLNLDDVVAAIDGHILLSFSDLSMPMANDSVNKDAGFNFNFLFKTGIRDKAKFQKLLDALNKMRGIAGESDVAFESNDNTFVISNHKEFADNYLAGKADNKQDWLGNITGHPFGMFININKILSSIRVPDDSTAVAMMNKSKEVWNEVISHGGEIKDNALTVQTKVTFMDKNTNSLKILNSYFDQMYILGKDKKKNSQVDTGTIPPPVEDTMVK